MCIFKYIFLRKMRSCEILVGNRADWHRCDVYVYSTVLPSLVFEKNAFMSNTPLEKNRCFKFLRSVFDSTDTDVMYICGIQNRTDWCIFDRSPITSFEKNAFMWNTPLEKNRCFKFLRSVFDSTDTDVMYICGIRNRTDWCIFDRSPITSFEKNAFSFLEKNRCFISAKYDLTKRMCCRYANRCYFRPFSITSFEKNASCDVSNFCYFDLEWFSSIQLLETPMWCIYAVSETEQIDVFSTVLPSLVFEKNAFMWNTPLEKNRCFKFLRNRNGCLRFNTDVMYIFAVSNFYHV